MNIAQVFYLARCASKTPEEREQIKQVEELLDKFMTSAQAMVETTRTPDRHDVGSAQLILSLHHSAETGQAVKNMLTSYWHAGGVTHTGRDLLVNKGAPAVKVKHVIDNRLAWERACRTQDAWDEFKKYGYRVENTERIDVLKAIVASYLAEHADVPEWLSTELAAEKAKPTKAKLTPKKKK